MSDCGDLNGENPLLELPIEDEFTFEVKKEPKVTRINESRAQLHRKHLLRSSKSSVVFHLHLILTVHTLHLK